MREAVTWAGREVGWIDWSPDTFGVQVTVTCAKTQNPQALLRCYGQTAGEPLRIGLLEPQHDSLYLSRHLSRETLKAHGCMELPPSAFYLSDGQSQKQRLWTGDEVVDMLLEDGAVEVQQQPGGVLLCCPFVRDKPFALAPVFVLCTVERGRAMLRLQAKPSGQGFDLCKRSIK